MTWRNQFYTWGMSVKAGIHCCLHWVDAVEVFEVYMFADGTNIL